MNKGERETKMLETGKMVRRCAMSRARSLYWKSRIRDDLIARVQPKLPATMKRIEVKDAFCKKLIIMS